MFCNKCGTQLPDDSVFCMKCGNSLSSESHIPAQNSNVNFVPAQCTNCGASLNVDPSQKSAICPFCKSAYVIEQAINNYNIKVQGNLKVENATINVSGVNIENLLLRAKDFYIKGKYDEATDYFNRVLDVDINNSVALQGLKDVEESIANYIYFETKANIAFSFGRLILKKNKLIYKNNNGKETVYEIDNILSLENSMLTLKMTMNNKIVPVIIGCQYVDNWIMIIENAIQGIYPPRQ